MEAVKLQPKPMKILVDFGSYHVNNLGDVAMLQASIKRIRRLFPNAVFFIFTLAPELLRVHFPNAKPLDPSGRDIWLGSRLKFVDSLLPWRIAKYLMIPDEYVRSRDPLVWSPWILRQLKRYDNDEFERVYAFLQVITKADLVVVAGGGYITDAFSGHGIRVLKTLEMATNLGKPTALMGQGIGPIQKPGLYKKLRSVLPAVDLITLREARHGPRLLESCGLNANQLFVTGDDAIELAYSARTNVSGYGIGVNLRAAKYSEVGSETIAEVRNVLRLMARKYSAPLISVPIDQNRDVKVNQCMIEGYELMDEETHFPTVKELVKHISKCRIVVTGSYHAAVFALSQGIPSVCLARSDYYEVKFLGLADQFGVGCDVLLIDQEQFQETLMTKIDAIWKMSPEVRKPLLEAAQRQVLLAQDAYQRLLEIVN